MGEAGTDPEAAAAEASAVSSASPACRLQQRTSGVCLPDSNATGVWGPLATGPAESGELTEGGCLALGQVLWGPPWERATLRASSGPTLPGEVTSVGRRRRVRS